jgi:chorismate dehydratase
VSYLNARPLIEGLEAHPDVAVHLDVPARLADGLHDGRFDVALLPTIDYQGVDGLVVLPVGGIGSRGPSLTVRIFSRVPVERIDVLACDTESHSSVALARIILEKAYGLRPELVRLDQATAHSAAAQLLIGDKVVCDAPQGMAHQVDLGEQWARLTGLPFVFAAWMMRDTADATLAQERLAQSRAAGMASTDTIVWRYAVPRGWPADLARQYLTRNLHYEIGPAELAGIRRFFDLAHECGILAAPPRPLVVLDQVP